MASGVVGVGVFVVVVGVCNRSQMRTSTCLIFGVSIGLDLTLAIESTKGIFDKSKFKVTRDISPTISGWLLVCFFLVNKMTQKGRPMGEFYEILGIVKIWIRGAP